MHFYQKKNAFQWKEAISGYSKGMFMFIRNFLRKCRDPTSDSLLDSFELRPRRTASSSVLQDIAILRKFFSNKLDYLWKHWLAFSFADVCWNQAQKLNCASWELLKWADSEVSGHSANSRCLPLFR